MQPIFSQIEVPEFLRRLLYRTITIFFSGLLIACGQIATGQTYPSYGPEIQVTINGLSFDAMEPFISSDGNYLFLTT